MRELVAENVFTVHGRGKVAVVLMADIEGLQVGETVLIEHAGEKTEKVVTGIEMTKKLLHPPIPGTMASLVIRDQTEAEKELWRTTDSRTGEVFRRLVTEELKKK